MLTTTKRRPMNWREVEQPERSPRSSLLLLFLLPSRRWRVQVEEQQVH